MTTLISNAPSVEILEPSTETSGQDTDDGVGVVAVATSDQDVREQLAILGNFLPAVFYACLQEVFTWLTGKPYWGQQPILTVNGTYQLITALSALFGGITATFIIQQSSPIYLPLLIFSWAYTVGGARKIQTSICHQCIHHNFFGDQRDRLLGEMLSTMLIIQDFDGYYDDHVRRHHPRRTFASFEYDPDAQFLAILGFQPGTASSTLWKKLWITIVSPRFHWLFLQARIKANFVNSSPQRRIAADLWILVLIAIVMLTGAYTPFIMAVVFPLVVLYHIAALFQFISEHEWGSRNNDPTAKSHGRFCGEAPPKDCSPLLWCIWFLNMIGHFIVRVAILSGEMPEHDWHHKSPKTQKEWANSTYVRQREVEEGKAYLDFWGINNAIEHVFQGIAEARPDSDS